MVSIEIPIPLDGQLYDRQTDGNGKRMAAGSVRPLMDAIPFASESGRPGCWALALALALIGKRTALPKQAGGK
jgi:hypothetical protein